MSTPSADSPVPEAAPVQRVTVDLPTTCHLCEKALKHADVVMLGVSSEDKTIAVHPNCMVPGKNEKVKGLNQVHVHVEKGKQISGAKSIVVKKRIKEIFKAVAIAQERAKLAEQQG